MTGKIDKIKQAKGFIFDLDGTLAHSQKYHYQAYNLVLKEFGITYTQEEDANIYAGQGSEVILPTILQKNNLIIDHEKMIELIRKKREIYDNLIEKNKIEIIPGIREFLKYAKSKKIKVIIATGNRLSIAKRILQKTKLHHYFNDVITNSHVDNPKPAPDIFLYATKMIGLNHNNCIVFEDSSHVLMGAKKYGFTCVGITSSHSKKMLIAAGADIIIKDYFDLLKKLIITNSYAAKKSHKKDNKKGNTQKSSEKKYRPKSNRMVGEIS
jgi:beta-phosphoglucomutase